MTEYEVRPEIIQPVVDTPEGETTSSLEYLEKRLGPFTGEEEEWNEEVDIAQAVAKARKAFHKHFEDEGLESAFWRLKIVVERLDFEFKEVLNRTTFEEVG